MSDLSNRELGNRPKVGRPRRGTEAARADGLLNAATRIFLSMGYGAASIDKVAAEAGVSTRTIYERFRNKADLLGAVLSRLIENDMAAVLAPDGLDRLPPHQALMMIGNAITVRARDAEYAALFRILATEAQRFPELAAKMRGSTKTKIDAGIAAYLRGQVDRGSLQLKDPARAAVLFLQMVFGELHEILLFGPPEELMRLDLEVHLKAVIEIFLNGALPRDNVIPGHS